MKIAPPTLKKVNLVPLSQQPPLKVEVLSSLPFFENLVGDSTRRPPHPPALAERGCTLCSCNGLEQLIKDENAEIFSCNCFSSES